jgi:hypothetical protein
MEQRMDHAEDDGRGGAPGADDAGLLDPADRSPLAPVVLMLIFLIAIAGLWGTSYAAVGG